MPERVDNRWGRKVIGRHVDRLHGGDGGVQRTADALLKLGEFGRHRRLVTHSRREPAHESRDLRARLHEAEHVVHEHEYVAALVVTEVLGHRKGCVTNPEAGARWFAHLPEDQHGVAKHTGVADVANELLCLAGSFSYPAEEAHAAVPRRHVVDELGDEDRLPYAGATEQAGLAAPLHGREEVDRLDSGWQDFRGDRLPFEWHGWLQQWTTAHSLHFARSVDGLAEDVEHPAQHSRAHGDMQRLTRVRYLITPGHAGGGGKSQTTNRPLVYLAHHLKAHPALGPGKQQRVESRRLSLEAHVDNPAANGYHLTGRSLAQGRSFFGVASCGLAFHGLTLPDALACVC